jgi:hypothetical protein
MRWIKRILFVIGILALLFFIWLNTGCTDARSGVAMTRMTNILHKVAGALDDMELDDMDLDLDYDDAFDSDSSIDIEYGSFESTADADYSSDMAVIDSGGFDGGDCGGGE